MLELAIPLWPFSPAELRELVRRELGENPLLEAAEPETALRVAVAVWPRATHRPRRTPWVVG